MHAGHGLSSPDTSATVVESQVAQGGVWRVMVAQNTNAGPGAPEADDIKLPIRLPKAQPKP